MIFLKSTLFALLESYALTSKIFDQTLIKQQCDNANVHFCLSLYDVLISN